MVQPQLLVKVVSSGQQLLVKGVHEAYDGIVDDGGSGTFETLQAADDVLDAGAYALWVKSATYAAGLTVSTNDAYIFFEPGTVVQAAMTFSGNNITVVLGAGCDIQGLITLSGNSTSLICLGGCDIDGILASGDDCYVKGGGWDTISDGAAANHGIHMSGARGVVENISCQTTAGEGNNLDGLRVTGGNCHAARVRVIDSDRIGIFLVTGNDNIVTDCEVSNCDTEGIEIDSVRNIVKGNVSKSAGNNGILVVGDNNVIADNVVQQDSASPSLQLNSGADNNIVDGNRLDGAITDNGTGNTVASNDTTGF